MLDEYVEVIEERRPVGSGDQSIAIRKTAGLGWSSLESSPRVESRTVHDSPLSLRLSNWRDTIRGHKSKGASAHGCASGWAAMYVQIRNTEANLGKDAERGAGTRRQPDEEDGWRIEAAVRQLADPDDVTVLREWYVFEMSEHAIRCLLKLRRVTVQQVRQRAERNLQIVLAAREKRD
ncbi:hypothetical protein [Herbaspirillum sp. NPDC101396]|uniref:hypothetical protein n=1 Tax=Herbaspirillum sp. NPDC101396 TaxID=3364005 RepID=UPI003839E3D9